MTHRLVIVGGGVAGLDLASHLATRSVGDQPLAVTLVDREPAYVWKPLLHTIAAGTSDAGTQQTLYAAQALAKGFFFEFGEVVAVDRASRRVELAQLVREGRTIVPRRYISYDTLVLAIGSRAFGFGIPGVEEHCATIDTRSDAIAFNDRLRLALIEATMHDRPLNVAIVGGGATGVELAAELIQVATVAERFGLRGASGRIHVTLVESGPRLLAAFPPRISEQAKAKLTQLGVEVRLDARVKAVDTDKLYFTADTALQADMLVWAAGVQGPSLVRTLDLEQSGTGRLLVDGNLRSIGDPRVFALGDCASVYIRGHDRSLPTTAQVASQEAAYLTRYFTRIIAEERCPDFAYADFGGLISLGEIDGYGSLGRVGFFRLYVRGRVAQLGHSLLHRKFQIRLHGVFKGTLLWMLDTLSKRARPRARLS